MPKVHYITTDSDCGLETSLYGSKADFNKAFAELLDAFFEDAGYRNRTADFENIQAAADYIFEHEINSDASVIWGEEEITLPEGR